MKFKMRLCLHIYLMTLSLVLSGCSDSNNEVGEFNNDWTGNEVKIEALIDDKVEGVVCHMAHFDRSFYDRVTKGNWFENPSNGSISCGISGPVTIGNIAMGKDGEEVFSQKQSLLFKTLAVRRIYDAPNNTLLYLVYSRKIVDGSAKMSIATVPLAMADVEWDAAQSAHIE